MAKSLLTTLALLTVTATPVLSACLGGHTFGACADRTVHWYDPDTGEICDPLDCGGGRAPVKTNVPGCAAYKGTLTRPTEASYMPCFTSGVLVTTTVEDLPEPITTTLKTVTTTTAAAAVVMVPTSSAAGQADETDSAGAAASSSSEKASPSEDAGENGGDSTTTGAASASTPVTTAPPASASFAGAGAGAGSGGDEAGSSSTTVSEGAGSVVGASWIAAVVGVALGALGVL